MTQNTVLYEVKDGIARVTLNRPEKRNALNGELVSELKTALAESAPSARAQGPDAANGGSRVAVLCATLDEVRDLADRAFEVAPAVGAVLAAYIPSPLVALLSAAGIAAIRLDAASAKGLKGQRTLALPAPSQWPETAAATVAVGPAKLPLTWLARGAERAWATGGPTETTGAKDVRARSSADR